MLEPLRIPGLIVVGTDTEIGKTVVAGAIADWFRRRSFQTSVLKPVATGCVHRREGLVSEDAEFLAACADARFPLDLICPQRYEEPLAPAVAADRTQQPVDWAAIQRSIRLMSERSDVLIVEGVGGIMVPIDAQHYVLDVARWLRKPAVVVARPDLGTINHTLLTINALRGAGVPLAGVVINRYRADGASVAEETNGRAIEKWGKTCILATVPEVSREQIALVATAGLPADVTAAIDPVDWSAIVENVKP